MADETNKTDKRAALHRELDRLLDAANANKHTGPGLLLVDFNQGGVTNVKQVIGAVVK
jgi:hypothetical protein